MLILSTKEVPMKSAVLNLNIDPEVKKLVVEASKLDRRSISGFLEVLILEHCPKIIEAKKCLWPTPLSNQNA
jgi:uncharacterized protein (DUF1778 family)